MQATVAIALGSNLGDRAGHLDFAAARLPEFLTSLKVSRWYETPTGAKILQAETRESGKAAASLPRADVPDARARLIEQFDTQTQGTERMVASLAAMTKADAHAAGAGAPRLGHRRQPACLHRPGADATRAPFPAALLGTRRPRPLRGADPRPRHRARDRSEELRRSG